MGDTDAGIATLGVESLPEPTRRWGASALGIVIGVALAAGAIALPAIGGWLLAIADDAEAGGAVRPVRELDREWRWTPKAVEFDFIFRTVDHGPLPWLMEHRS